MENDDSFHTYHKFLKTVRKTILYRTLEESNHDAVLCHMKVASISTKDPFAEEVKEIALNLVSDMLDVVNAD
eukprot:5223912-Pleurochrysis_carterae.AAC.1